MTLATHSRKRFVAAQEQLLYCLPSIGFMIVCECRITQSRTMKVKGLFQFSSWILMLLHNEKLFMNCTPARRVVHDVLIQSQSGFLFHTKAKNYYAAYAHSKFDTPCFCHFCGYNQVYS